MREILNIPPPANYLTFGPSELFRFFFQVGRWTEDSFSSEFQTYTHGKLISTVTINKWKNRNVIPKRYSGPLFKMIKDQFEPKIAEDWIMAFENVWATHIARAKTTPNKAPNSNFSDRISQQHCEWINSLYTQKRNEDSLSNSDLYIPLQFIGRNEKLRPLYDTEELVDIFSTRDKPSNEKNWMFICGGHGSGKSMTAIHLAREISNKDIFPIYLRGSHFSDIKIDIENPPKAIIDSFSFKSFLHHFRASSFKTACLILDGLDEILDGNKGPAPILEQVLRDLCIQQNVCRAHGKELNIIAFGIPAYIRFAETCIPRKKSITLDILGLDGRDHYSKENRIIGRDLRRAWWTKYLTAIGLKYDPILPNFLCSDFDDYSEFGSNPLLAFIICQLALTPNLKNLSDNLPHEAVNALTEVDNRNKVYEDILRIIYRETSLPKGHRSDFESSLSVLQHIALARWHNGDNRDIWLDDVHKNISNLPTERLIDALKLAPSDMLITRASLSPEEDNAQLNPSAIKFTHKTFGDYLVSTLIFSSFERLIRALTENMNLTEAMMDWQRISSKGIHEPNLAEFCQKEAKLRYQTLSHLDWDGVFKLLRNHMKLAPSDTTGTEAIIRAQRSSSLLLFTWSCLNLERQRQTGVHFDLFKDPDQFSSLDLKTIQRPNALDLTFGPSTEPVTQIRTFLTPTLSATNIQSADMSHLSFTIGHMQSVNCTSSSFAMTHWSHVKLTKSIFQKTTFQHAILHGNRWLQSNFKDCLFHATKIQLTNFSHSEFKNVIFSQCHFSDVDFMSVEMHGVIFDRCSFTHCHFDMKFASREKKDVKFRHCIFLEMETALERMGSSKFEDCQFQTHAKQKGIAKKNTEFASHIGELLR